MTEKKAKKKPAIPLNDVMLALDKKDRDWYNRLSEEQQKAFSGWMMMRYASSCQGSNAAHYIYAVNELVNCNFADIYKHPELQWQLFSICGSGKKEYHPYIKPPTSRKKKNTVYDWFAERFPLLKASELELMLNMNTDDQLKQYARDTGLDDKQIKEIFGSK